MCLPTECVEIIPKSFQQTPLLPPQPYSSETPKILSPRGRASAWLWPAGAEKDLGSIGSEQAIEAVRSCRLPRYDSRAKRAGDLVHGDGKHHCESLSFEWWGRGRRHMSGLRALALDGAEDGDGGREE